MQAGAQRSCLDSRRKMGATIQRQIKLAAVLMFLGMAMSGLLRAQTSNGTITGQVVDGKNALVPGARVTVADADGTFTTTTTTNRAGIYSVPSVPPGVYTVTVEASGFQQSKIEQVDVPVAGVVTVDALLKVGEVTQSITVTERDPLLNSSSATLETTIDQSMTVELPFAERSSLGAVMFAPGVTGDPGYADGVGTELPQAFQGGVSPGVALSIGGSRNGAVSQLVDGSDVTLMSVPRVGISFSADAIRSVTVLSVGLSAQYGRTGGGIINQATAAGTGVYHGTLRWRHTDPDFQANPVNSGGARAGNHTNLFTVAVGGPVPLPFHRHETFFFAAFEPLRYTNKSWIAKRLLSPDEVAGRFANSYDEINTTTLKMSGWAAALAAPRVAGQYYQFAHNAQGFPIGNRLSSTQYVHIANDDLSAVAANNPITKFLYATYPNPNKPTPYARFDFADASFLPNGYNGFGARGVKTQDNRYTFRIDENVTDRDRVYFRYTSVPVSGARYDYLGPDDPRGNIPTESVLSQSMALSYVRTVSQNKVNEFRVTYLISNDTTGPNLPSRAKDFGASIGLPPAVEGIGLAGFSMGSGTNLTSFGNDCACQATINKNYGFGDDFSILKGRHSLKFGVNYRAMQVDMDPTQNLWGGAFTASGSGNGASSSSLGSVTASYMLGLFSTYTVNTPHKYYYRWKYGAAYIQDDWRALPKLTINAGMRYNIETPRMEKYNYQGSFIPNGMGTLNGVPATGGFAFSGTNGLPETLWPINYLGFEPRLGISYQLEKSITIRASYALIHAPLTGLGLDIVPNLTSTSSQIGGNGQGGVDSTAWVNLITNLIASSPPPSAPPVSSNLIESWAGTSYLPYIRDQSKSVPYVQLRSFSLQIQPGKGTLIEADYVGQKGTHLYSTPVPTNDPPISTLLAGIAAETNFNATSVDQWGNTTNALEKLRPFPQFNSNAIWSAFDRYAGSNYNALYLTGRQQAAFGITLLASFSWSKSMDDASSSLGGPNEVAIDTYGFIRPQGYSIRGDYSLSAFDIPFHLTAGYVWKFPIGRGEKHFANTPRWANWLVAGWSTSGQVNTQSGYPYQILASSGGRTPGYWCSTTKTGTQPCDNGSALEDVYLRPNRVPGVPIYLKNWRKDPFGVTPGDGMLNPAAWSFPGSLNNPQFGTARRSYGDVRNPRAIFWNASVRKRFEVVPRRVHLEVYADAINVLNHANYNIPSANSTLTGVYSTTLQPGPGGPKDNPQFGVNPQFGLAYSASSQRVINLGAAVTF